jgi:hypothetical protein
MSPEPGTPSGPEPGVPGSPAGEGPGSAGPRLGPSASAVDLIGLENVPPGLRLGGLAMLLMGVAAPLIWSGVSDDPRLEWAAWIFWAASVLASATAYALLSPQPGSGSRLRLAWWVMFGLFALMLAGPAMRIAFVLDDSLGSFNAVKFSRYLVAMAIGIVGSFPRLLASYCPRSLVGLRRLWNGFFVLVVLTGVCGFWFPQSHWAFAALGPIAFFLARRTAREVWLEGIARHAKSFAHEGPAPVVEGLRPADER